VSAVQLEQLLAAGCTVAIEPGTELFHEGQRADHWWLLVDGEITLSRFVGREDTRVGTMDAPGRWAGGFSAWDAEGVYLATGRGSVPGRVLRVPAEELGRLTREWFPFGTHLIEGLYRTARSIESTARQRESMASLGRIAAGLAHELNNPAAAATRAVDGLAEAYGELLEMLGQLAGEEITARQFSALDGLRRELGNVGRLEPLALSDREEELWDWLDEHDVLDEGGAAAALAAAGADTDWLERLGTVLEDKALQFGVAWVAGTLAADTLLTDVKESTRRISELVGAVRSYSQMDRASLQRADVREGLESTLTMLAHKIGAGVRVERSLPPDPCWIEGFPGELNQVWTNLVDNAIDAMDGSGTLQVVCGQDGSDVVVEIADTGPGMSPEVLQRAFEAFYTTKDVGKGTGLGLDIARRIVVERHGGHIDIDSAPGRTVFTVRLPERAKQG
jgi:signal transduction histidine kinase